MSEHEPRNAKIQTVGPSVFKQIPIRILHELDTVVLTIGGADLKMDYMAALEVAEKLRLHAKQAKKFAGHAKLRVVSTGGSLLTDAEENDKRGWR